jgi:formylglycine-generating enzyme required for sulfatase activity
MFVRQPVTIGVLAEIVLHQWGTGTPPRKSWFAPKPKPSPSKATPFTQLGGVLSEREWLKGPLFESMAANGQGYSQFRRRTDGMRCVGLPAAEVQLGSDHADSLPDQRPCHRAQLASFLVDAEPVSATAYARFLNSVGSIESTILLEWCGVTADDRRGRHFQLAKSRGRWGPAAATEHQPMILVSWFGANAYALWANCRDWRQYRGANSCFLPTEAQWEYAARGAEARLFPWGDGPVTADQARVALHTARSTYPEGLPLAGVTEQLGISPFELRHMAGNVWQWCADWYAADFYQSVQARQPNPLNTQPTGIRSERGGSWIGPADLARSSYRRGRPPAARGRCLGFRCVSMIDDIPR